VFRCREVIFGFSKARQELMQQIRESLNTIEAQTGKVFGSSEKPLLLSVRSGSAISMPGMMATVHNVGQNSDLVEEFVKPTAMNISPGTTTGVFCSPGR
jgi:pyruvate,orthophosphate dikinase